MKFIDLQDAPISYAAAANKNVRVNVTETEVEFGGAYLEYGLASAIGAAGRLGRMYWATDSKILYRDDGVDWVEILRGEAVSRLASLAEKAHASLTGVSSDQHHEKLHALDSALVHSGTLIPAQITDGAITETKLGALAVVEAKIGALAVTEAKLGALAVTEAKIGALAVTEGKIGAGAVTVDKHGDASVSQAKLKTSTGTWSISIAPGERAGTNLVDYSFFPKQSESIANCLWLWDFSYPGTTQVFRIGSYNVNAESTVTWAGTYRYVAASEQIIDLMVDPVTNEIIGIHITEKGNEGSMYLYDKDRKEIPMLSVVLNESFIENAKDIKELSTKPKFLSEIMRRGIRID